MKLKNAKDDIALMPIWQSILCVLFLLGMALFVASQLIKAFLN